MDDSRRIFYCFFREVNKFSLRNLEMNGLAWVENIRIRGQRLKNTQSLVLKYPKAASELFLGFHEHFSLDQINVLIESR